MDFSIPVIDLGGIENDQNLHEDVVRKIRRASETCGFFQIVNHGIPMGVLEEMLCGVRRFFEQDTEMKKPFYTRDGTREFVYNSNFDLYTELEGYFFLFHGSKSARGRRIAGCVLVFEEGWVLVVLKLRDIQMQYSKHVMSLGLRLFALLSESLGLESGRLTEMECANGLTFIGHYYPAYPQPELTLGASKHTDDGFLTVLLQDQIGGLQILVENQWIDIPAVPGALVINIGDLLQLISNDKFKSAEHRVVANRQGPRVSVACFFSTSFRQSSTVYGPIQDLVSEDDPSKYRETTAQEYVSYSFSKGLDGISPLLHFKI